MSRSRKKTPIHGVCGTNAGTMASFRKRTSKRMRKITKVDLATQDPEALTDPRRPEEAIERWSAPDDGKFYNSHLPAKYLRK